MTSRNRFRIWKRRYATWDNLWRVLLMLSMIAFAIWTLYLSWRFSDYVLRTWSPWGYSLVNLGPEMAGIVVGVIFIDLLNERRQNQQLKAQLIRQMGSPIKDVAVPATRELVYHDWLYDGSLKGAKLFGANLEGAKISMANLEAAFLVEAQLEGAYLFRANLERAYLTGAHLNGVLLHGANLKGAKLGGANLEGADLALADLDGAKYLTKKQLRDVKSVARAIMPDGVKLKDTDSLKPYLYGPTLEEWLATEPECLEQRDDTEYGDYDFEDFLALIDSVYLKDEEE